jgi:L-lactate dehydrogenase
MPPSSPPLAAIASSTKDKAYSIIAAKGATAFGIATVVSSICESILFHLRHIRPVSHWVESLQCCVSLPAVLGRGGVLQTVDLPLSDEERHQMKKSVEAIRKCLDDVEKNRK